MNKKIIICTIGVTLALISFCVLYTTMKNNGKPFGLSIGIENMTDNGTSVNIKVEHNGGLVRNETFLLEKYGNSTCYKSIHIDCNGFYRISIFVDANRTKEIEVTVSNHMSCIFEIYDDRIEIPAAPPP